MLDVTAAAAEGRAVAFGGRRARSDGRKKEKQRKKQRAVFRYHGNVSNLVGVGSSEPPPPPLFISLFILRAISLLPNQAQLYPIAWAD